MKFYSFLTWIGIITLLLFFQNCNYQSSDYSQTSAPPIQPLTFCEKYCQLLEIDTSFIVEEECYHCAAKNYENSPSPFKVDSSLIKGFRVNPQEIHQMLDTINDFSKVEVFAMLTIRDSAIIKSNGLQADTLIVQVPDLIFVLQEEVNSEVKSQFFDFTAPCPHYCPVFQLQQTNQ